MTPGERKALIAYRLDQADDTLEQASILASAGKWSGVINRAYYAMFYGATALLAQRGLESRKHSGVLALVDKEFVRAGILSREQSIQLRAAFFLRQQAD